MTVAQPCECTECTHKNGENGHFDMYIFPHTKPLSLGLARNTAPSRGKKSGVPFCGPTGVIHVKLHQPLLLQITLNNLSPLDHLQVRGTVCFKNPPGRKVKDHGKSLAECGWNP